MMTKLQPDPDGLDPSLVPQTSSGVFACEPCLERDRCRMGILATRMEGQTLWLDIEVPDEYREFGGLAHSSWVGGIMAEICGLLPPFSASLCSWERSPCASTAAYRWGSACSAGSGSTNSRGAR